MRVHHLAFAIGLVLTSSCSTFFGSDKASEESAGAAGSVRTSATDALELRVAQLWSRVDDLEAQLIQQKERNKLLEKGLMLGIIPDELKAEDERPAKSLPKAQARPATDAGAKLEIAKPAPVAVEQSHDRALYRKMLADAQDKFNRANYGQAIAAYNDIGAKFDDGITEGNQFYWVGLSWFYLKEYKLSDESFNSLRERYPSNPWVNHAAFYQAKIEENRGFHQRALDQFQKILDENPDKDLGEMARAEITRMKEKL